MPKSGPRTTYRYTDDFKATADVSDIDVFSLESQGPHDQKGQERDGDRVNVLRPRYADAKREPDAGYADRIEQLAAE